MSNLIIKQIPCLSDNYGYLVHDPQSGATITIDTPDANAILEALKEENWQLSAIWNTHHHWDHAGGNAAIKEATGCLIFAPKGEADMIKGADHYIGEGDSVSLGAHAVQIIETPGHTRGHICYVFNEERVAFVGDTLFSLGCGRLFEGSPEQMWTSLSKLMALPDETRIYCAHEYTKDNARFANTIEPENTDLQDRIAQIDNLRGKGAPTIPVPLGVEKATNPFLRAQSPAIRTRLKMENASDSAVFARIRQMKDDF